MRLSRPAGYDHEAADAARLHDDSDPSADATPRRRTSPAIAEPHFEELDDSHKEAAIAALTRLMRTYLAEASKRKEP